MLVTAGNASGPAPYNEPERHTYMPALPENAKPLMLTAEQTRDARGQLRADYTESVRMFCPNGAASADPYKMFSLGVVMAILTLKGFADDEKNRVRGLDMEGSVEAYYEAARKQIHAD